MGFNGTDGVNGTQGIQGTPGITNLNNTNTYLVTTSGNTNLGFALCMPGDFIITGGYSSGSLGSLGGVPVVNRPSFSSDSRWMGSTDRHSYRYRCNIFCVCSLL